MIEISRIFHIQVYRILQVNEEKIRVRNITNSSTKDILWIEIICKMKISKSFTIYPY